MAFFYKSTDSRTGIDVVLDNEQLCRTLKAVNTFKKKNDDDERSIRGVKEITEEIKAKIKTSRDEKLNTLILSNFNLSERELINVYHINELSHIVNLDLARNELETLPQELCQMTQIKTLKLSNNKSLFRSDNKDDDDDEIDRNQDKWKWIAEMPNLEELQLRFIDIERWPSFLNSSTSLRILDLSFNELSLKNPSTQETPAVSSPTTTSISDYFSNFFGRKKSTPQILPTPQRPPREKILVSLTSLDLSNNRITTIPMKLIRRLPALLELKLNGNDLRKISNQPSENNNQLRLTRLELVECKLIQLPAVVLNEMRQLRILLLDRNSSLCSLPEQTGECLPDLDELSVNNTGIDSIQLERILNTMVQLRKLCANKNKIRGELTMRSCKMSKMRVLELNRNTLTRLIIIDDKILPFLISVLDLSYNKIVYLDDDIGYKLKELTHLFINDNNISCVPTSIGMLRHLVELRLDHNKIEKLDGEHFKLLTNLRILVLSHNKLDRIPHEIATLTELEQIDVSHNRITEPILPHNSSLKFLEKLNLEYNYLTRVIAPSDDNHDDDISGFILLQELRLAYNEFTKLPQGLLSCENIRTLTLDQNSQALVDATETLLFKEWMNKYGIHVSNTFEVPVKVTDKIYLGSMQAAASRLVLSSLGITHVLTVANDARPRHLDDQYENLTCLHLQLPETNNSMLKPLFERAFSFIEQGKQHGGVLVHCLAGVNRSVSIVIAYLMYSEHLSYEVAFEKVRSVKSEIKPMHTFIQQLNFYDKELSQERKYLSSQKK